MANSYPSPCDKCKSASRCHYKQGCVAWQIRYRYRQKQINAYAKILNQKAVKEDLLMGNNCPCKGCTRVKDPRDCENKSCAEWREWWLKRWEAMRKRWLN